jgi:hypothetical protein
LVDAIAIGRNFYLIMAYLKECFSRQLLHNKIVLNEMLNIVYIGTIAKWMDWDLLVLKSLELNSEILYHFVGPETIVPEHSEYYHIWAKTTQEIKSIMAEADICRFK